FENGQTASVITTPPSCSSASGALASAAVGSYTISCSGGVAPNYSFSATTVPGGFSVSAKPLTYSASGTKVYGDRADVAQGNTCAGFENGQTASVITTPPSCSSASGALASAAVGSYAISCSGGVAPNYSFSATTVPGGFSVSAKPLTYSASGTKVY